MTPRILLSSSNGDRGAYECAIRNSGGEPISCYCPGVDLSYDGLLLCGGDDVDPARFGQDNRGSQGIDLGRDQAELALAEAFLKAGKPILGICRGHQLLNIALGGTLIQNITPEQCAFHTHEDAFLRDKVHPIRTAQGSALRTLFGPLAAVNSSHHQALDRVGEGLEPTAWSECGLVEAVEHRSLPVLGVQFHPERMAYSRRRPDTADGSVVFAWFMRRIVGV